MNKNWPKNTKYGYFVCLIHFKASKALNGMFCVFISCKGVLKTKEKRSIEEHLTDGGKKAELKKKETRLQ